MSQSPTRARNRASGALELVPDVVLPEQCGGAPHLERPIRRLMRSILEDAIGCLKHGRQFRAARQAMLWINSDQVGWPFAYRTICEEIGLSHSETRRFARDLYHGRSSYQRVNRVSGTRTKMGGRGA